MFHSVLFEEEIIAILSLFSIPNRNKALETALALSTYSCVEVFTQTPLYLVTKQSEILFFSSFYSSFLFKLNNLFSNWGNVLLKISAP